MSVYNDLVHVIREQGAVYNPYDLVIAEVVEINPIKITYNSTLIEEDIYYNPSLLLGNNSTFQKIFEDCKEEQMKQFLIEFHQTYALNVSDSVLVQRVKDFFYIISKVVQT